MLHKDTHTHTHTQSVIWASDNRASAIYSRHSLAEFPHYVPGPKLALLLTWPKTFIRSWLAGTAARVPVETGRGVEPHDTSAATLVPEIPR